MVEFLFVEYRYLLQYCGFAALALFAWRCGEAPEKLIGLILCAAIAFALVLHFVLTPSSDSALRIEHMLLDVAMFSALAPIAMRANRIYPLWILAAQLIAVAMHFQRSIIADLPALAYWLLIRLPFWLQMGAFAAGLLSHRLRVRKGIVVPAWRHSLNH